MQLIIEDIKSRHQEPTSSEIERDLQMLVFESLTVLARAYVLPDNWLAQINGGEKGSATSGIGKSFICMALAE